MWVYVQISVVIFIVHKLVQAGSNPVDGGHSSSHGNLVSINKISKEASSVTRNWIIYNKSTAVAAGKEVAHAGVLLGLGLQGHLTILSAPDVSNYLTQGSEAITVAVLIGFAASRMGTCDPFTSKTLCLHLPSLLPPLRCDIEISATVQCAALSGLGLLYCGSSNRLMVEFLLGELMRTPTSDRYDNRCVKHLKCEVLLTMSSAPEMRWPWVQRGPLAWYY
jgi:hypothetical protein